MTLLPDDVLSNLIISGKPQLKCCETNFGCQYHRETHSCVLDHSPWVGNAVGNNNHKFFCLFVGYTMCSCLFTLVLMILRAIHCGLKDESSEDTHASTPNTDLVSDSEEDKDRFLTYIEGECVGFHRSMSVLVLLIVSLVFLIFTCCMLFEQIDAIETNSSKIARMKMSVGQAGTELSRVTEEFNEMFGGNSNKVSWHWFWPAPVEYPGGMKKVVLGYEWDETFDQVPYEEPTRDEEEGGNGKIELTTAGVSKLSSPSASGNDTPSTNPLSLTKNDGEEGDFSGTPVLTDQPRLTKRTNSRGPDGRAKASSGTLT